MPWEDWHGPLPLPVGDKTMQKVIRREKKARGRPTGQFVWAGIPVIATEHDTLGMGVFSVAEMILVSWVGRRPTPTSVARHLDGDKFNCAAANLVWHEPPTANAEK